MAPEPPVAIARFAHSIAHVPWFAAVGEDLTDADKAETRRYLDGLGLAGIGVAGVGGWGDVKRIADDPGWDHRWWDAEEALRRSLTRDAARVLGEGRLNPTLTRVSDAISDVAQGAAAVAAARSGVADPALIKSAAGAATMACHHAALAIVAGADIGHPFTAKLRLFAAGRWPLGIVAREFHVF